MPSIIDVCQTYIKMPSMSKCPLSKILIKLYYKQFYEKSFKSFFNEQKASKEAIRPKMFIKKFLIFFKLCMNFLW